MVISGNRENQILREAARAMRRRGYHGASMQEIAGNCGLQKGSLYHYFASKEEILDHVARRTMGLFRPGLQAISASGLPPCEKLRQAVNHHIVTLCKNLDYSAVLLQEFHSLPPEYQELIRTERDAYSALFRQILHEGIVQGEFRAVPVHLASLLFFGMLNWVYQWFSPDGPSTPEEIAEVCAELFLAALRPDAAEAS